MDCVIRLLYLHTKKAYRTYDKTTKLSFYCTHLAWINKNACYCSDILSKTELKTAATFWRFSYLLNTNKHARKARETEKERDREIEKIARKLCLHCKILISMERTKDCASKCNNSNGKNLHVKLHILNKSIFVCLF